jgi:16S rRNA (guanine527-N7)-methyltransferase
VVSRETLLAEYFPETGEKAAAYGEILKTRGIEWGLIGPKEGERIWDRHIANCLPITKLIPEGVSLIDIGSGAGLPGIVIALARPDLKVTLLEPLARRAEFLTGVAAELGLDIQIKRGKAEQEKGHFDIVTGRAVAPLPKFVEITWHLVKSGGAILAMKGAAAEEEISEFKAGKVPHNMEKIELHTVTLGDLEPSRIVELRKAG